MRRQRILCAALILAALGPGCTSLRSAQRPVVTSDEIRASLAKFKWAHAVQAFHGADDDVARKGLTKRQYRDLVITQYMLGIDANYAEFRANADSESRASDLGFELGLLGLAGVASVAEPDEAGKLAAAITAFTGARATFDKTLFFNKTLPAIFAAMDEERARRRLVLVQGMQRDEQQYSLPQALPDIVAYQEAGSFPLAISNVVARSVEKKNEAVASLDNAVAGCEVFDDLQEIGKSLRVSTTSPDAGRQRARIDVAAKELQLPQGLAMADFLDLALLKLDTDYCDKKTRNAKVLEIIAKLP